MNHPICYNCGGELTERGRRLVCRYCGSYAPENVSSEEAILLASASRKLRLADFLEAEQEFEDLICRYPHNAHGYWGHMMSKYGIKYEEDYDGSRIPTCYAASIESVYTSADYQKALALADPESKTVFEEHAAYVEHVRKEWVEKASKEPPYDIFISYKEGDRERGLKRTPDSVAMQELYLQLKDMGYRVFFSRESLRGKTGEKYEPYIFNALSTARVMLVYGSHPDYFRAAWVKNEWGRYLKRMRAGEKKQGSLLVAYEGFSPSELPGALSALQCLDAGEKRFYTDLFAAIESILAQNIPRKAETPVQTGAYCNHEPRFIPGKAPTCTEDGWSESTVCKRCGAILKKIEILPAAGHHFGDWRIVKAATCTEDGAYESVCECGERKTQSIPSAGGHVAGPWETVKEPAPGKKGLRTKKCMICGERVEEETIPALPLPKNGKPSEGLAYMVNEDGKTCTVTGIGTCKDAELVIPDTFNGYSVTSIGERAFSCCQSLVSAVIPDSVTSIGERAFSLCESLTDVLIGNSVHTISDGAFAYCKSLVSVVIPDSVTCIRGLAFVYCTSLASLCIPDSVTVISYYTFSGCTSLTSLCIPDSVTVIGYCTFSGCTSLTSLCIPDSVTSIGEYAFAGCTSITSIRYTGTKRQWKKIRFHKSWRNKVPAHTVECKNGAIRLK